MLFLRLISFLDAKYYPIVGKLIYLSILIVMLVWVFILIKTINTRVGMCRICFTSFSIGTASIVVRLPKTPPDFCTGILMLMMQHHY